MHQGDMEKNKIFLKRNFLCLLFKSVIDQNVQKYFIMLLQKIQIELQQCVEFVEDYKNAFDVSIWKKI